MIKLIISEGCRRDAGLAEQGDPPGPGPLRPADERRPWRHAEGARLRARRLGRQGLRIVGHRRSQLRNRLHDTGKRCNLCTQLHACLANRAGHLRYF